MDKETLANHISKLGKRDFEIACRITLSSALGLTAINVDGAGDGGTDFAQIEDGKRTRVAYQITTQKTDIKNKAYNDAKKSLNRLRVNKFFFLTTYHLSEEESRSIERVIEDDLEISASVFSPSTISGLLIQFNLVTDFLNETGFPDLRAMNSSSIDYQQMALHSYTLLSSDAKNLKEQIYDDTILLVLYDFPKGGSKEEIVSATCSLLSLPALKEDVINRRLDSLISKKKLIKSADGLFFLSDEAKNDIRNRKAIYEKELESLSSAQTDVLRDYGVMWTIDDARLASVWIANAYLSKQLSVLQDVDAPLAKVFNKYSAENGISELRKYLIKKKKIDVSDVDSIVSSFLSTAATQPLLKKISRAFVYVALEGKNPIQSCRALGINRWSEMKLFMEPTIGIPLLCSYLFSGQVNDSFDKTISAVNQAKDLGIQMYVSYYYIKECAGHLHMARKYDGLDLNPEEMIYSSNAFVSNYYSLKKQGIRVPDTFLDYLSVFSTNIRIEKSYKDWIRSIMTDIQTLFTRKGMASFIDVPLYSTQETKSIEDMYISYLEEKGIEKSRSLMMNDVTALKFTQDQCAKGEHWMILTYDRSLIGVAKQLHDSVWVVSPNVFSQMVEISKPLDSKNILALVHSIAQSSESTLSICARIIDKIVYFASDKMQDWEFMQEINKFKEDIINSNLSISDDRLIEIDKMTDDFLTKHGVSIELDEDNEVELHPVSVSE